jgi:hypothetical protein
MRALLILVPLWCACEPKVPECWPHDAGVEDPSDPCYFGRRYVTFTPDGGGFFLEVDAMDSTRWSAVDLDRSLEVLFEEDGWDLAFQRFHIRARGGASGDGGVEIAFTDAGYADVTKAPAGPYLVDLPDGDDENTDLDTVFDKAGVWYEYEGMFHTLAPKPFTYFVKSDQGAYFKLKIDGYYDRSGTPALFKLQFAPVLPP